MGVGLTPGCPDRRPYAGTCSRPRDRRAAAGAIGAHARWRAPSGRRRPMRVVGARSRDRTRLGRSHTSCAWQLDRWQLSRVSCRMPPRPEQCPTCRAPAMPCGRGARGPDVAPPSAPCAAKPAVRQLSDDRRPSSACRRGRRTVTGVGELQRSSERQPQPMHSVRPIFGARARCAIDRRGAETDRRAVGARSEAASSVPISSRVSPRAGRTRCACAAADLGRVTRPAAPRRSARPRGAAR